MKKLLLIMLPMLAALLLGSCRGDDGPMGPEGPMGPAGRDGRDGIDGKDGEGMKTLEFTFGVKQNDWEIVKDSKEPYFRYEFDFKELESSIIDHGMLTVYRMLDDDYYATLPVTKLHKDTNDNGDIFYTQLIDYEFAPGKISFYVTNSDFYIDEKPDAMDFKVVVHYY
ncbi:MAG: collagen-like protein [Bacteroidales bacterium]|jgi:hypothetical protein|nr:collagen-like protein [Bacteroidales bacterium]